MVKHFSWYFFSLMNLYPEQNYFDSKMHLAESEFFQSNQAAQKAMSENYGSFPC